MTKCNQKSKELIHELVEILATILFLPDEDIMLDALYGLKSLTSTEEEAEELETYKFNEIADAFIVRKVVDIVESMDKMSIHAMRVIGNITAVNNKSLENQMMDANIIGVFQKCFEMTSVHTVKKELVWSVSNLVVDNEEIANVFVDHAYFKLVLEESKNSTASDLTRECYWAIANTIDT